MAITLNNIDHDYGGQPVLKGVTGEVSRGDRIGIVGPNGCGKTTLVRIICGDLEPVSGTVIREPGTKIGHVPQHLDARDDLSVGRFLLGHILEARSELRLIEERMSALDGDDQAALESTLRAYQAARDPYDNMEGDTAEERAERLLGELGLPGGLEQEIRTLSGGERNVLALARALVDQPTVLILDEPGNHLDFAGLAWLESFLSRFDGAVVVVSHNRYLLDRVATEIWEIFGHRLNTHTGNYSDYRFSRLTQAISDQAVYSVQQKALGRLEELVRTFEERARVTGDPKWGKRLRARRTQLEKARELAMDRPEIEERGIRVAFADGKNKSDIAVQVGSYSRSVGDRQLFDTADLLVHVGERVGIVGPNGCGKTTFLTDLVTRGNWENLELRVGPSMRVGFCAQQRDRFPPEMPIQDVMLTPGSFTRNDIFKVLSQLLFRWEDLERPVSSLSGGEWNRLQLALAIISRANLLILDEPTNHLDIQSREAVEEALADFSGTVIAVSHDRYFLDASVKRIVEIQERTFVSFDGSFTEYWFERGGAHRVAGATLEARGRQTGARSPGDADGNADFRRQRRTRAANTGAQRENRRIEEKLLSLEERGRDLERRMADAFARGSHADGRRLARELEKVRSRTEELYTRWGDG